MKLLFGDVETYSECDLKAHGTHRYAADPSTEIQVVQWSLGDGEIHVEDLTGGQRPGDELLQHLNNPDVLLVFHNSAFDRTLIRHCWGIDIPPERWLDTMIQGMSHGLPGGLDRIGQAIGIDEDKAKDKRGRELIQLFCRPRPKGQILRRATRETHPQEWAEFLVYSYQDIVAMREIHAKMPKWNYRPGHFELDLWRLDQKINDRGFAVDVELAEAAVEAVAVEQARLKDETQLLTDGDVSGPSKRDELLKHILAEYGVELPDMKADTLRRRLEDPELPDGVKLLISLRLESTKTSTAKYKALLKAVSADGRLRNSLQFAGAIRTSRWAGRIFQPQNMTRPDMEADDIEFGIDQLKAGTATVFFDDVMRLCSNAVRGCIVAPPFKKLCIADLANIEGRGLAYLAGENWKIKAFRDYDAGTGPDLYVAAYARSFNVGHDQVGKKQRQIGKVQELGLGYEGGVAAFITFAAVYHMDLDELADAVWATASAEAIENAQGMLAWVKSKRRSTYGLSDRVYVACEVLKRAWRDAHPCTEALWKAAKEGVTSAIGNPGQQFSIGRHLIARRDGAWLRIRLPSGRYLCYLHPEVDESGQISYMGVSQYTRQWTRLKTYGGKLIENCTQAFARDIMAYNMPAVDAAGYEIVLTVHDELLTETPDDPSFTSDELATMMATVPPWAAGIPLAAAGFETTRYRKD